MGTTMLSSLGSTFKEGEDRLRSTNTVAILDVPEPVLRSAPSISPPPCPAPAPAPAVCVAARLEAARVIDGDGAAAA